MFVLTGFVFIVYACYISQEDTGELEHLLNALDTGCPPHGGIALGM